MRTYTHLMLLALFTLVMLPFATQAQTYHPILTDSSGSWNHVTWHLGDIRTDTTYYTTEDTVFSGNTYRVIRRFGPETITAYVREDTAAQQVFFWHNGVDRLMYDFSLTVGDTFMPMNQWSSTVLTVTDTGTISTLAGPRRFLKLTGYFYSNPYNEGVWLEGVGDTVMTFNYPVTYPVWGGAAQLRCAQKEGIKVWGGRPCELNNFTSLDVNVAPEPFAVFPQPSNGELNLEFPEEVFGAVSAELMDLQGRVMWREEVLGSGYRLALDVGGAIAGEGVYVLRVVAGDEVFVRKVLLGR